jgi:hypothetical protein
MDGRSTGVQKKNQLGRCEDRQQCQDERQHQGQHQAHHQDQYRWQHQGSHRYQASTSTSTSTLIPSLKELWIPLLHSPTPEFHFNIQISTSNLSLSHFPLSTSPSQQSIPLAAEVPWWIGKKTMTHYIHSRSSEKFD